MALEQFYGMITMLFCVGVNLTLKGQVQLHFLQQVHIFLAKEVHMWKVITGLNNTAVEGAYHIIPFVSEKIIIEEYQFSVADIADVSMINLFDTDIYNGTENYSYAVYWDNATKEIFYNTGNYNTGSGHWQDSGFSYNIVSTVPYRVELLYDTSTNKYVGLWIDNTYFNFSNFTVGYIDSTISPRIQIRPSITHGNTAKYAELEFWDYTISAG